MNRLRGFAVVAAFALTGATLGVPVAAGAAVNPVTGVWPSELRAGQQLTEGGGELRSPSGAFILVTAEGALTLSENADTSDTTGVGEAVWEVGATATEAGRYRRSRVVMQRDGDLVLRDGRGRVLWRSGTAGTGRANRLTLSDRGNLDIRTRRGKVVWSSHTTSVLLAPGQVLAAGHYLRYRPLHTHRPWTQLTMQRNGRLVLTIGRRAVWHAPTAAPGSYLRLARGGDITIEAPNGRRLWHTRTGGHSGAYLLMTEGAFRLFIVRRHGDDVLAFHAP